MTKISHFNEIRLVSIFMARRFDDTVDKKRVNSCVQKHLFVGGSSSTQKIAKKSRKCSFRRATNVTF